MFLRGACDLLDITKVIKKYFWSSGVKGKCSCKRITLQSGTTERCEVPPVHSLGPRAAATPTPTRRLPCAARERPRPPAALRRPSEVARNTSNVSDISPPSVLWHSTCDLPQAAIGGALYTFSALAGWSCDNRTCMCFVKRYYVKKYMQNRNLINLFFIFLNETFLFQSITRVSQHICL